MTSISSYPIDLSSIKRLNLDPSSLRQRTPEEIAQSEEIFKSQFRKMTSKPDNDPDNIYAQVKVGGKVVATLYNSGASETSNDAYGKLKHLFSFSEQETTVGPDLAQKRAEDIAAALGGTVVKASTAKTQATWRPETPEWTYDYDAMNAALAEREKQMESARIAREAFNASASSKVAAQMLGQADVGAML